MVPNVIPGEVVRVRIYRNFKSYSEADLVKIITSSPDRITPKCPLFEECGGCQYQHIPIRLQRVYKQEQVQQLLDRAIECKDTMFPSVLPTLGTEDEYYYRSKITPHYNALAAGSANIGPIGFNRKNGSQRAILDVEHCVIATRPINDKLVHLRKELREKALNGTLKRPSRGATLLLRQYGKDEVTTDPNQLVSTTVNNLKFSFLAGNFFQNNPFILPLMVQHVIDGAAFSKSGRKMTHLIDCYCGSGLFCLSASHLFETCVGIEVNEKAITEARYNGKLNNIENCSFIAASAEAIFESNDLIQWRNGDEIGEAKVSCVRDFPRETTVVVLDPPRKGCSPEFMEQLYKFEPQRIIYMSCDPSTQARDANGLVSNGYEIVSVQPFDLFPQTRHIESLIIFERQFINKAHSEQ
jgi:23S rRNA (uracil1939-C5)-methyltransferase/tRNA (uracil-5-)-methyltransferase